MKKLKIFRNRLELLSVELVTSTIVIGRSPFCDGILRAPGVAPVHFLLEWIGEGAFDPEEGFWTLFVIAESPKESNGNVNLNADATTGEGIIITENPVELDGFSFVLFRDALAAANIEKGAVGNAIQQEYQRHAVVDGKLVLEVARFKKADNVFVDIVHEQMPLKPSRVSRTPEIKFHWQALDGEIQFLQDDVIRAHSLKAPTKNLVESKKMRISKGDVYKIETSKYELYLRLVRKIQLPHVPLEILKDKFLLYMLAAIIFSAVGILFLRSRPMQPEIENLSKEPRVVTIREVREPVATPVPTPQPTVTPEPTPPPPTPQPTPLLTPPPAPTVAPTVAPQPAPAHKSKDFEKPKEKENVSTVATFKTQKAPMKEGLNAPAKVANVNVVGLLGKMRKMSGPKGTVSSSDLTQTFVDDAATGASGRVVLQNSKAGIVSMDRAGTGGAEGGESALGEASTTLQGSKFDPTASGTLARGEGIQGKYGLGGGPGATGHRAGGGKGGNGPGGAGESVSGGLDREAIRKEIAKHRREIRTCFESALTVRNDLKGMIVYRWNISPQGTVTTVKLESSEMKSDLVESCVLGIIRDIVFPKASNAQPTDVIYPFFFQKS